MAKPQEINNACPTKGSWTNAILVVTGDNHWSAGRQVVREGSLVVSKDRELQRASLTLRWVNAASSRPPPQLCHPGQLRAVAGGSSVFTLTLTSLTRCHILSFVQLLGAPTQGCSAGKGSVLSETSSHPALTFSQYCSQSQNTNLGHLPWESGYPMSTDFCYTCTCVWNPFTPQ